jgi:hypothetical protein
VEKIPKEKIAIILLQKLNKTANCAVGYFAWRVDLMKTSVTSKSVMFFTFIVVNPILHTAWLNKYPCTDFEKKY